MGCLVQNDSKLMIQSYPTGSIHYAYFLTIFKMASSVSLGLVALR